MNLKTFFLSFFLAVCALCFLSAGISAQEARPTPQHVSTFSNRSFAYKLTDQDFANTPSWNPDDSEPPLSVSRAVKIARENLPRFIKNSGTWKMQMVWLQSFGDDKWYYRINFFCLGASCRDLEERSFMAIVKMDGTIIEPKKVTIEN